MTRLILCQRHQGRTLGLLDIMEIQGEHAGYWYRLMRHYQRQYQREGIGCVLHVERADHDTIIIR